ncbi:MAG TPA: DUF5985 family protein [Pirellulales bacterium]|nr:DUF5985 family protein [Pirellulales bacterium]
MAVLIYLLCAATAAACTILLWRSYRINGVRLLFWSSACFLGLAVENVLLHLDRITFPHTDLSIYWNLVGLVSLLSLVYGLVWDSK